MQSLNSRIGRLDGQPFARAKLVLLTQESKRRVALALQRQAKWVEKLAEDMTAQSVENAVTSIRATSERLHRDQSIHRDASKV